jgi:carboxyl-terminal processing protease
MRRAYLFILITCLTTCKPKERGANELEGIWQSLGYGRILEIKNGNYFFYDITKNSCLPARSSTITELTKSSKLRNDTLLLRQGILDYYYTRLHRLPEICNQNSSDIANEDVLYNFEVFAQTVKDHFAYFELNNIVWDSLYSTQKRKLHSNPTKTKLYQVLNETLILLNDNHGQVEADEDLYETRDPLSDENAKEYGDFEIAEIVTKSFLEKNLTVNSDIIKWGRVNERIGYIQIKAMWLFADLKLSDSLIQKNGWVPSYASEMTRLNEAKYIDLEIEGVNRIMDRVMDDLAQYDCIIIDVRFNGGGQDGVSLEILKRFNDRRRRIATHKAKLGAGFTPMQPIYLESSDKAYTKPIFILTSRQSASATDLFALATLEFSHVKRIGSKTNGAISTALEKRLPNGWYFSISNEMFLDNNGLCYENIGVPVDFEIDYPADRQAFFRWIEANSTLDKQNILRLIEELTTR